MKQLLIGCGTNRQKKVTIPGMAVEWDELVTLDVDPSVKPDIVCDLNILPLPFDDNTFDEIHAYEVLEHCGKQGDWRFFFDQFHEFWRILKPGGLMVGSVPAWDSPWAWGDPGHTRCIPKESFTFLSQAQYAQVGDTAMTDYRPWWKGDFEPTGIHEEGHQMAFVLKAIK